jgi:hypothetical protein
MFFRTDLSIFSDAGVPVGHLGHPLVRGHAPELTHLAEVQQRRNPVPPLRPSAYRSDRSWFSILPSGLSLCNQFANLAEFFFAGRLHLKRAQRKLTRTAAEESGRSTHA